MGDGRGESMSLSEVEMLQLLFLGLSAEGVKEMHVGPRSHDAFEKVLLLARLRSSDIHFHSGYGFAENFLLFNSCALRLAEWYDDTMVFRLRPDTAKKWLKEDGYDTEEVEFWKTVAHAFIGEYPKLFKRSIS